MYSPTKVLTLLVVLCLSMVGAQASTGAGEEPHARAYDHPGHVPIGEPGLDTEITRTIEVNIKELSLIHI